jgi:hypothetical protein
MKTCPCCEQLLPDDHFQESRAFKQLDTKCRACFKALADGADAKVKQRNGNRKSWADGMMGRLNIQEDEY